jgi:hypothetical protein
MTKTKQYNDFACVAACFESIKRDLSDADFSHEAFIRENLGLFNGGTEIEGSCPPWKTSPRWRVEWVWIAALTKPMSSISLMVP